MLPDLRLILALHAHGIYPCRDDCTPACLTVVAPCPHASAAWTCPTSCCPLSWQTGVTIPMRVGSTPDCCGAATLPR